MRLISKTCFCCGVRAAVAFCKAYCSSCKAILSNVFAGAAVSFIPEGSVCKNSSSLARSEEHTSELQSLMRISYAVFCLKKKNNIQSTEYHQYITTIKIYK